MTTFSSVTARDCITSTRLHFLSSIDGTRAKVVSSSVGHRAPLVQSLLSIDNLLDNSHSLKIINQAFLRREGIFFKTKTKVGKVRLLRTNETRRGSMARARARDTAFYLCRPFCGTTERHLVFTATPRRANPPSHPHADIYESPAVSSSRNVLVVFSPPFLAEIRVHSSRSRMETNTPPLCFIHRLIRRSAPITF